MSLADVLPLSPPATSSGSRKRTLPLFASKPTTSTPHESPASGPESCSQGSKKKVEFSPWANIHHPFALAASSLDSSSMKPLPPSRENQFYIKSILKFTTQNGRPATGFDGPADHTLSLNDIMESIIHQLSKNDNAEAIDAYQTLASTIKAYDEIPEQAVLKNKLNTIVKQLRLHLNALNKPDPQPSDINLVTSALKVVIVLVWTPHFALLLTDDFRSFLLDRAVAIIAEHSAPKGVITHYLHLLATQDFRQGLLIANSRAPRLLEALRGLTDHVKGNGVVVERLLVYQKLLDQTRPIMKAKASQWVEYMLSGMASNITDTREKALALGRKACQAFPASSSISGSVRLALDLKQENGKTMGMWLCRRLEKMATSKDDPTQVSQVPQIWAVILLLCNNSSMRIDSWQGLKEWLMVIQRCFNGSDSALRIQANSAWNRFVYIARPHEASDSLVAMLAKPVAAQLDRATNDKSSKTSHAVAISSYCNLLYYAFRPATSVFQCNRVWNEYIVKLMRSTFFEKCSRNADIASRILMSLFWDTKANTKVWNENRAHENRLVDPEELPTIDCRWIRSRCAPILEIFQLLFQYSSWGLPIPSDQAFVAKAWRHFLKAIREAGSKEIKMSNEMRAAIVCVLGFLSQLWKAREQQTSKDNPESGYLSKDVLAIVSHATLAELGISRIMETMEADTVALFPPLFANMFQMLKLDLKPGDKSQALVIRLLTILNASLISRYKGLASTPLLESYLLLETVSQILFSVPTESTQLALQILSPGLALWLRDEDGYLSVKDDPELEQSSTRLKAMLGHFSKEFTVALSSVSPQCIKTLDTCLAAAFSSSHKTVVNAMVELWNNEFGVCDEVEIGPQLTEVLRRLLPYVHLQLPAKWMRIEVEHQLQPVPAYGTQFHSISTIDAEIQDPDIVSKKVTKRTIERDQCDRLELTGQTTVRNGRPKWPSSTTKRPHDDSQIDFVAVESSPPDIRAEESQFLTDRQREVRDRQREEAIVTFPDLRSSPQLQSKNSEPRNCGFARKVATMAERPATPTLPDNDGLDAEPEPSPTPRSRFSREVSEVDVPSSPPSMHGASERRDVEIDDVSSPMPDADELRDREGELDSPFRLSHVEQQPPDSNIDVGGLQAPTKEVEIGTVPESIEALGDVVQVGDKHLQLDGPTNDSTDVISQEKAGTQAHDSAEVAGKAELPSSTPQQAVKTVVTPPQHSASILDSDELEELSASQLSRDLDWAAVLDPLTSPATEYRSPSPSKGPAIAPQAGKDLTLPAQQHKALDQGMGESELHTDGLESVQSQPFQKKRKRPQFGYAGPKKRKKHSRSQSQSSSSQASNIKREEEEELLDCIVVEPSSELARSSSPELQAEQQANEYDTSQQASHIEESQDLSLVAGSTRRGRGRPRKVLRPVPNADELDGVKLHLDSTQDRTSNQLSQRGVSRKRLRQRLSLTPTPEPDHEERNHGDGRQTQYQRALIPVVKVTLSASDNQPAPNVDRSQVAERAEHARSPSSPSINVLASLQAVLDQLKTAPPGTVDLRAIDELCFQIRFQAQIATMGSVV